MINLDKKKFMPFMGIITKSKNKFTHTQKKNQALMAIKIITIKSQIMY